MKETLISFCIVNLNAKNHLISCLKSISMSTKCGFFEIIVVDNNSNDGSIEFLRYQYPEVRLIINLRNFLSKHIDSDVHFLHTQKNGKNLGV